MRKTKHTVRTLDVYTNDDEALNAFEAGVLVRSSDNVQYTKQFVQSLKDRGIKTLRIEYNGWRNAVTVEL